MKILIINNNNPLRASGVVALDLFNGLRRKGHEVKLLVNEYSPDYPADIISMETPFDVKRKNFLYKIDRRIKLRKNFEFNNDYHFHRLREKDYSFDVKKLFSKAKISPDVI